MVDLDNLKTKSEKVLRPLKKLLLKRKIGSFQVTAIAVLGSLFVGLLLFFSQYSLKWLYVLVIWVIIKTMLYTIESMMTQEDGLGTYESALFRDLGSVLSELFLYIPLISPKEVAPIVVLFYIFAAFATEFCGLMVTTIGVDKQTQGPLGKNERTLYMGILALLTALFPPLIVLWNTFFIAGIVFCGLTCSNRIRSGLAIAGRKKKR